MKLNRLLEITILLLCKRTVTAAELAGRFGVSARTIYRDIDVLSASGVPVCTTQGVGGGISMMEDYTLGRAALSETERDSVMLALRTLQSTRYPDADRVLQKLGALFHDASADWVSVDFTHWGSNPNANDKFTDIRKAIQDRRVVEIDYINAQNTRTTRPVEPEKLVFKYQAWYLQAWCRQKSQLRTFRLSRIKKVRLTQETFDVRKPRNEERPAMESTHPAPVHLVIRFGEEALHRLYDDYDEHMVRDNGDGTYMLEFDFPEDDWVYGYILSFGTYAEVLSPPHIRDIIREKSEAIAQYYR